ncbi:MAG: cytochrome c [Rhodospirillaceae bacterium]|nr:cytochrome c [Rhodospirillaceae bacterium]
MGLVLLAGSAAADEPAWQQEDAVIEEVRVTARRREESAQEVPMSLLALSRSELKDNRVTNLYSRNRHIQAVDAPVWRCRDLAVPRVARLLPRTADVQAAAGIAVLALSMAVSADVPVAERGIWGGIFTNQQAQRGREQYLEQCSECHLENLVGRFPAPPLRGDGFLSRWYGKSVRDFYTRMRTTMPVDTPGSLSREETLAITAYLFQANGFPGGIRELAGTPQELDEIELSPKVEVSRKGGQGDGDGS